ncbi:MAG TPA: sialate O-acetylesterase [Tepidisphaeraceae bacterium]|jgi:sialate O-acetylesterase|nr:sialate O-acetylesterase [Tepidisphaeraceae bacterium]
MKNILRFVAIGLFGFFPAAAHAGVKLPKIFGDHMVLQRGMNAPLWGWADPGEKITVSLPGSSQNTVADLSGHWRITIPPMQPPAPVSIVVTGKNSITINDVLFGEVWICSGQSNMQFALSHASNARHALATADHPTLRLFVAEREFNDQPQDDLNDGHWEISSPKTAHDFSAVGYFFGAELLDALNTPIGLIEADWGGTRAEAWIPRKIFDQLPLPYEPQWTEAMIHPRPPGVTTGPAGLELEQAPARLYNSMIHPLARYAIRGVIWYQGESNAPYPAQYADVMTALIKSWRTAWNQGDFPFLIVQLANYDVTHAIEIQAPELGGGWPRIRAAQAKLASDLPNVGLAVTIDIGNPKDIHPRNKTEVGRRLALAARKLAYGQSIESAGPTFRSLQIDGPNVTVSFDHADGLKSKGDPLQGFEIAGPDNQFSPGIATILGNQVIVTSNTIKSPLSIRYGWSDNPTCTLYNSSNLPAVPFWPNPKPPTPAEN